MFSESCWLKKIASIDLPIVKSIDDIVNHLSQYQNLILQAEAGAGKTTLVPIALLEVVPKDKKILVLEPRRLAARNAAVRMASIIDEEVGKTVGFRIRNETNVSVATRIEVITEGILTRMLQSDPELVDVGLIIFDEFHERSVDADLGLAFALEVQQTLREDLKLLVMSATLDTKSIAQLLHDSSIIKVKGRSYPVSIEYISASTRLQSYSSNKKQQWLQPLLSATDQAIDKTDKDILIFLPGVAEIRQTKKILEERLSAVLVKNRVEIVQLYGDLAFAQQQKALMPIARKRKIILSTNIAETSVTIEGVDCVIDSGLMRQSEFDPNVGFDRLFTKKISLASATQRAGRAGRLSAGLCYRLWSESEELRAETVPEILRTDLASFVLELAKWGMTNPADIALLDQPSAGSLQQAQSLLTDLKALDKQNKINTHGGNILSLGVHPRVGHMLLSSIALGSVELACLVAAMLEEKDILQGEARFNSDYLTRIEYIVNASKCNKNYQQILLQSKNLKNKLSRFIRLSNIKQKDTSQVMELAPILTAMVFPDRIAQKRGNGYRLSNGSGVSVNENFSLESKNLVVIKQGGQGTNAKIFQAIEITQEQLEFYFSDQIVEIENIYWDKKSQSVKAEYLTKLRELVLSSQMMTNLSHSQLLTGLLQGIQNDGLDKLGWTIELRQWQARVIALHELEKYKKIFPDVSDDNLLNTLDDWLAPYLNGKNKLSQINHEVLSQALKNILNWEQQQSLDQLMPITIKVASGSKIKLDYLQGDKPVLAVKLQEMFGQKENLAVASGLIPVIVHLLSPARRPLQITEDLAGFWLSSYQLVKKDMKGRYPKHPWPDDPLTAQATRFTKKRS